MQSLTPTESSSFPQNIIIYPAGNVDYNRSKILSTENFTDLQELFAEEEKSSAEIKQTRLDTIVFAFTQDFAQKNLDRIIDFSKYLEEASIQSEILLSCNDEWSPVFKNHNQSHPTGTETYTVNLNYADNICVLVLEEASSEHNLSKIICGNISTVSPAWLTRSIHSALENHQLDPKLTRYPGILYSLGMIPDSSKRLNIFFDHQIPAAAYYMGNSDTDFAALKEIASRMNNTKSIKWDKSYSLVEFDNKNFWPGEGLYVSTFILFSMIILFRICFIFFAISDINSAYIKDIKKSWFIFPVVIMLTWLTLLLSQAISIHIFENPIHVIGTKIIFAFLTTFILILLLSALHLNISLVSCGFQMTFIAAVNFFIFSIRNIEFSNVFFVSWILLIFARKSNKIYSKIITFFLPILMFLPYVIDFVNNANYYSLLNITSFSSGANLLFAMLLFPMQMQWARISLSLDLFNKSYKHSVKKNILYGFLLILVSITAIATVFSVTSKILIRKSNILMKDDNIIPVEESYENRYVNAEIQKDKFLDRSVKTLKIHSDETVMRYNVSIMNTGNQALLYDSNYDYTYEDKNILYFKIPDYPAGPIEINFSASEYQYAEIRIEAFIMKEGRIIKETYRISLHG